MQRLAAKLGGALGATEEGEEGSDTTRTGLTESTEPEPRGAHRNQGNQGACRDLTQVLCRYVMDK